MAIKKYIYEVRSAVPLKISKDFRLWLEDHIEDMLSLDYFTAATTADGESLDDPQKHLFVVRYELRNKQDLYEYLQNAAPLMRSKLPPEFTGNVEYLRALLTETSSS